MCVCTCVDGEGRGACILKLQQYSSIYYMYRAPNEKIEGAPISNLFY